VMNPHPANYRDWSDVKETPWCLQQPAEAQPKECCFSHNTSTKISFTAAPKGRGTTSDRVGKCRQQRKGAREWLTIMKEDISGSGPAKRMQAAVTQSSVHFAHKWCPKAQCSSSLLRRRHTTDGKRRLVIFSENCNAVWLRWRRDTSGGTKNNDDTNHAIHFPLKNMLILARLTFNEQIIPFEIM
jgi:hypothetical protein